MNYEREQANVPEEPNIQPKDPPDKGNLPPEDLDPPDNTGGNTVVSDI